MHLSSCLSRLRLQSMRWWVGHHARLTPGRWEIRRWCTSDDEVGGHLGARDCSCRSPIEGWIGQVVLDAFMYVLCVWRNTKLQSRRGVCGCEIVRACMRVCARVRVGVCGSACVRVFMFVVLCARMHSCVARTRAHLYLQLRLHAIFWFGPFYGSDSGFAFLPLSDSWPLAACLKPQRFDMANCAGLGGHADCCR